MGLTRHFCTYLDKYYLVKGLALYSSLRRHVGSFHLWILCFDNYSYQLFLRLSIPNLHPIPPSLLEREDTDLLIAKRNRTRIEYYFTCTPSWMLYILDNFHNVDLITYLDADLFFYSDPEPIFEELGMESILIVEHRFPRHLAHREKFGKYNVGLISIRNSEEGVKCLEWWRERCIEWCHDRPEDGKFADQKYLDEWPTRFKDLVVLQHKGAGLAPWNWMNYNIEVINDQVLVDGQPLIFYHFHRLMPLNRFLCDAGVAPFPLKLRRHIYAPYMRELLLTESWLKASTPAATDWFYGSLRYAHYPPRALLGKLIRGHLLFTLNTFVL